MKSLVTIGAVTILGACASRPAVDQADYGPPPSNPEYLIANYIASSFKDPYSAQIGGIRGPGRVFVQGLLSSSYGWGLCFTVNAKNSFGGYTGYRTHALILRDGALVRALTVGNTIYEDADVGYICRTVPERGEAQRAAAEPARSISPPVPVGPDAYAVERMPEVKACNALPTVFAVGKGPGYQDYMVSCSAGGMIAVRCEMGNCRVMR